MKKRGFDKSIAIFLLLQLGIYLAFSACALWLPEATALEHGLKYAGVLLCLFFVATGRQKALTYYDHRCVLLALLATAAADIFLLFTSHHSPGLAVFCWAHVFYLYRYHSPLAKPAAYITALACIGLPLLRSFAPALPMLILFAGLYAILILCAALAACCANLPRINRRLAVAGMLLFLLCDIHVALFNLLPGRHPYYPIVDFLMWFFYLPSQVLISLSARSFRKGRGTAKR